jgi:hypothetical protein
MNLEGEIAFDQEIKILVFGEKADEFCKTFQKKLEGTIKIKATDYKISLYSANKFKNNVDWRGSHINICILDMEKGKHSKDYLGWNNHALGYFSFLSSKIVLGYNESKYQIYLNSLIEKKKNEQKVEIGEKKKKVVKGKRNKLERYLRAMFEFRRSEEDDIKFEDKFFKKIIQGSNIGEFNVEEIMKQSITDYVNNVNRFNYENSDECKKKQAEELLKKIYKSTLNSKVREFIVDLYDLYMWAIHYQCDTDRKSFLILLKIYREKHQEKTEKYVNLMRNVAIVLFFLIPIVSLAVTLPIYFYIRNKFENEEFLLNQLEINIKNIESNRGDFRKLFRSQVKGFMLTEVGVADELVNRRKRSLLLFHPTFNFHKNLQDDIEENKKLEKVQGTIKNILNKKTFF